MSRPIIIAQFALFMLTGSAACHLVLGITEGETKAADGGNGGAAVGGGGGAAGGAGGAGAAEPLLPPSCRATGEGTSECGAMDGSCCESLTVQGDGFVRSEGFCDVTPKNEEYYEATISDFRLDKYEVTIGRYRAFLAAYEAPPAEHAGEHESIAGSGWQTTWPQLTRLQLLAELEQCPGNWTDSASGREDAPINCVSWHAAFLFCEWDQARLPTEAEWEYAACGGDIQREYPWGPQPPDNTRAVFQCSGCEAPPIARVGSKPLGAGYWSQLDLAGNVREWTLDVSRIIEEPEDFCQHESPCDDCAVVEGGSKRIHRGGSHQSDYELGTAVRRERTATSTDPQQGFRCARAALE